MELNLKRSKVWEVFMNLFTTKMVVAPFFHVIQCLKTYTVHEHLGSKSLID